MASRNTVSLRQSTGRSLLAVEAMAQTGDPMVERGVIEADAMARLRRIARWFLAINLDPEPRTMTPSGSRRVRRTGMGRPAEPPAPVRTHRQHSSRRGRGPLLCPRRARRHRGVTRANQPPTDPGARSGPAPGIAGPVPGQVEAAADESVTLRHRITVAGDPGAAQDRPHGSECHLFNRRRALRRRPLDRRRHDGSGCQARSSAERI